MVRKYKRTTDRANISEEDMGAAVNAVLERRLSIRNAASTYNLKKSTLENRLKKVKKQRTMQQTIAKETGEQGEEVENIEQQHMEVEEHTSNIFTWSFQSKYASQQVFTTEQENMLCKYLLHSSRINYGLTYLQAQKLAFEYAKMLQRKYPSSWDRKEKAGKDWMLSFMGRFPCLALRKPENTSMNRAMGFNETNVGQFFDNLQTALEKYKIPPEKIYNLDETGVTTVVQAPKVISATGIKQVGQTVSAERGELVTFCAVINAVGNTIPPVYVFPRSKYKQVFLRGAPNGSLGLANKSGSGWMTSSLFLEVVKHIKKFTKCTREDPILILLDNHESHTSLETINFCRENGIIFVTFPPHCTHRLQPLDVCVYGPFKIYLKTVFNDWLSSNPGKRVSIYEIADLTGRAYCKAFTMENICSGFKKCGIAPFNRFVFTEGDYAAASISSHVTKDVIPHYQESQENRSTSTPEDSETPIQAEEPSSTSNTSTSLTIVTPDRFRPYPRFERKSLKKGRQPGKSRILTSTPEKHNALDLQQKKEKNNQRKHLFKDPSNVQRNSKKESQQIEDETDISDKSVAYEDESDYLSEFELEDSEDEFLKHFQPLIDPETELPNVFVGDFVLVKYSTKKSLKYYVGEVENVINGQYQINFMRKKGNGFVFPIVVDEDTLEFEHIELKLPKPKEIKTTTRANSIKRFCVDLSSYNIL